MRRILGSLIVLSLLSQSWCSAQNQPNELVNTLIALETSMKSGHIEFQLPFLLGPEKSTQVMYCEWAPGGQYRIGESDKPPIAICDGEIVQTIDKGSWDARYITEASSGDFDSNLPELTSDQRKALKVVQSCYSATILDYLFPLTGIGGPRYASRGYGYTTTTEYPIPPPAVAYPTVADVYVLGCFTMNSQPDIALFIEPQHALLKAKGIKLPKELGAQWRWLLYRAEPVTVASGETLPGVMGYLDGETPPGNAFKLLPDKTRIGPVESDRFQIDRNTCAYYIPWYKTDHKAISEWISALVGPNPIPLLVLVLCILIVGLYISSLIKKAKRTKENEIF